MNFNNLIKSSWDNTPNFLKPLASNPISRRLCGLLFCGGTHYYSHYNWLLKAQWWPIEKMEEHRFNRLKSIIKHAYNKVPFYNHLFKNRGITPEDIKRVEDLDKIPVITKEDVLKYYNEFFTRPIKKQSLKTSLTGGSIGKPLTVSFDNNLWGHVRATGKFVKMLAGFDEFSLRISMPGNGPFYKRSDSLFEYNPVSRQMFFSWSLLSDNIFKQYVNIIRKFKPHYMDIHPSIAYSFAKFFAENNITDISFDSVLCSGEVLYDFQRKLIEKQLGCKVFNYYAHNEMLCLAAECEEHEGLHISEMGLVEVVDDNGEKIRAGKVGRLVATTLYNHTWPLIRYDSGDLGRIETKPCRCGRGFLRIKELQGRCNDMILLPDGKVIPPNYFTTIMEKFSFAKQFQFVQEDEKTLVLKVIKKERFDKKEVTYIQKIIKSLAGINLTIEYVDSIPFVGRKNKYCYIVSMLKQK